MIARVLERTGATVQARGAMYKAVSQSVLLYVRESWLVTGDMIKFLKAFYHRAARRITGMTEKRGAGGEWEYLEVDESMDAAGLHPIGVCIKRRKTTIAERGACRPEYALCTEAEQITVTSQMVQWWDQDVLN